LLQNNVNRKAGIVPYLTEFHGNKLASVTPNLSERLSCHAFKLSISSDQEGQCSEQDAHTTTKRISQFLTFDIKV